MWVLQWKLDRLALFCLSEIDHEDMKLLDLFQRYRIVKRRSNTYRLSSVHAIEQE